jgi:hypothetical protein
MYCKNCGTEQKDGQKFCPKCGTPFEQRVEVVQQEETIEQKPEDEAPDSPAEDSPIDIFMKNVQGITGSLKDCLKNVSGLPEKVGFATKIAVGLFLLWLFFSKAGFAFSLIWYVLIAVLLFFAFRKQKEADGGAIPPQYLSAAVCFLLMLILAIGVPSKQGNDWLGTDSEEMNDEDEIDIFNRQINEGYVWTNQRRDGWGKEMTEVFFFYPKDKQYGDFHSIYFYPNSYSPRVRGTYTITDGIIRVSGRDRGKWIDKNDHVTITLSIKKTGQSSVSVSSVVHGTTYSPDHTSYTDYWN